MINAAFKAFGHLIEPEFRSILLRSIGLALLLLIALWGILQSVAGYFLSDLTPWLDLTISVLTGLGMLVGMIFLIGPVSTLVAGVYLDDTAELVEKADYPADPPGKALPPQIAILRAVKFFAVVIIANLFALLLLLLPGVNLVAFLVVNSYLLGREFFELAAMRQHDEETADALRREFSGQIFLSGLLIAGFMAIPLVNLATPIFATALMVHMQKKLSRRSRAGDQAVFSSNRQ